MKADWANAQTAAELGTTQAARPTATSVAVVVSTLCELTVHVCYVDEAGCTGALPSSTSNIQPAFILVGVALPLAAVRQLTTDFLWLKHTFYPRALPAHSHFLDCVRFEVKGADLRKAAASDNPAERRHAIGFLDKTIRLLRNHRARIFGRVWVKGIARPFDGTAVYTRSMQEVCATFQHLLDATGTSGIVIADSRNKQKNSIVSHSIFTQKFRAAGDPYQRIVETPTFGHSDNHIGLQVCDLICSAFLYPMTMRAYCEGHVTSVHIRPGYQIFSSRYCSALGQLQHRYEASGRWRGGVSVMDMIARRSGSLLFPQ